jgi:hypothetical protein
LPPNTKHLRYAEVVNLLIVLELHARFDKRILENIMRGGGVNLRHFPLWAGGVGARVLHHGRDPLFGVLTPNIWKLLDMFMEQFMERRVAVQAGLLA